MPSVKLTFLVDDDDIFIYAMQKIITIKKLSEQVKAFHGVSEAIDQLKAQHDQVDELPDVIFLDINLPVQDGWDFLEAFKKIEDQLVKRPKLYMLSSSVNQSDQEKAAADPALNGFFMKPLSAEDFESAFS